MINQQNIVAYINYLHQKRTSQNAAPELLQKWSTLDNTEIPTQLQNLYTHWGLDINSARTHESNFLNFINPQQAALPNVQSAPVTSPYNPNFTAAKPKNNFWPALLGVLILGGGIGGFFAWQNYQQPTEEIVATSVQPTTNTNAYPNTVNTAPTPQQTATTTGPTQTAAPVNSNATAPQASSAPIPQASAANQSVPSTPSAASSNGLQITETDKENIQAISNLLDAEENRNFEALYSYFGPELKQYWDISMPTREELEARYNNTWSKISDGKNINMKVSKTGNNRYRVTGQYEYYSNKSESTKNVPVNTIFEFNDKGEIIYTNRAN